MKELLISKLFTMKRTCFAITKRDVNSSFGYHVASKKPFYGLKWTISIVIAFILITSISHGNLYASGVSDSINPLSGKKAKIKLFNGKSLDGWYTFIKGKGRNNDPNEVFSVQDGLIVISGEEFGCITTVDEYENYKLVVEFKWGETTHEPRVEKARDSGILLHSVGEDGGYSGIWMNSIECQLIEGGTGDFIVVNDGSSDYSITCPVAAEKQGNSYVFDPKGELVTINSGRINWYGRDPDWKDEKGFRGANDVEKPVGKWNRIECVVNGREIKVYLNSKLVNHAFDVKPNKGKIQIQSEGAEIFFRKVELTKLLPE